MPSDLIKQLLEAGVHFGHQTKRWNPKMKRFIFEERGGLHIIDLAKTLQLLRAAIEIVKGVVGARKSILFVGTKKQAKSVVKECAEAYHQTRSIDTTIEQHFRNHLGLK